MFTYACEDADITFRLYEILTEQLRTDELEQIARDVEFPLVTVLARMELAGIRIDQAMLATFSDVLAQEMRDVEQHIYEQAGRRVQYKFTGPARRYTF